MTKKKRIGIFGWGVVAPKSPTIDAFQDNLSNATSWLEPFNGFGPDNFLVGRPQFNFQDYKPWIDDRFEPRKFSQLESKMGSAVKYAIGAYIQSLSQNQGMEQLLIDLGQEAHIYVGTGLGDIPVTYNVSTQYFKAQRRWNRFWCQLEHHEALAKYDQMNEDQKAALVAEIGAPADPDPLGPDHEDYVDAREAWYGFWVERSNGLHQYLDEVRAIESANLEGDIDSNKGHHIRKKTVTLRRLNQKYGCPPEPWASVNPNLLWNIDNIPGAQISMLGRLKGPTIAPVAACAGFVSSLKLAELAISSGEAKAAVIGMTDAEPHPLVVGGFYGARVISHDGQTSKPFTGLRGTHISGGACIWIVGDYDFFVEKGMKPLGLEILGVGISADAHHIITPNEEGPRIAIRKALESAQIGPDEIDTWDMHATATPGDWMELNNFFAMFPKRARLTARKGSFGHGMSVCGGWELTAQHLGIASGRLHPVDVNADELHEQVRPYAGNFVKKEGESVPGPIAGKINMGVGGLNACAICRTWD